MNKLGGVILGATILIATPGIAKDATIVEATVSKVDGDETARLVEWKTEPPGAPVSITVQSPTPNGAVVLSRQAEESRFAYDGEDSVRTYFTLTPERGAPVTAALRVLPLEGARNFRDLGGYKTEDGRTVKWGLVYRSGVLHDLTDDAYDFIDDLGIKTVVDFRATEEREEEPTKWRGGDDTEFLTWDYSSASNSKFLAAILKKPDLSPADVTAAMAGFYGEMIYDHSEKYAAMFERLLETDAPLAFHCSAGKDRTGVGAALILTALGVDRETVIADYAMTELVVDYEAAFASEEEVDEDSPYAFLTKLPNEIVRPLLRSDPKYIKAAIERMEKDHGSVMGYIESELGVDENEIETLRTRLLH